MSVENLRVLSSLRLAFGALVMQLRHHSWHERPAVTGRDRRGSGWQTLRSFCDVIFVALLSSEDGGQRYFALCTKNKKEQNNDTCHPQTQSDALSGVSLGPVSSLKMFI